AELENLAKNPQNDVKKIIKINGLVQYYINKDDLIGKVIEIIENNINTKYTIEFPDIPTGKAKKKKKQNAETVINKFNEGVDIKELIIKNVILTYTEGNYIPYLRGDINNGYSIESYPLGLIEVSNYKIDGEPVVIMDIETLKKNLRNRDIFKGLKSNKLFSIPSNVEDEIKKTYPEEIYEAYKVGDKYAILNPERVGVSRINNLRGLYGLTPMFKTLPSQLMLETCDKVDRKNIIAKSKKIYHQKLRKEVLGKELDKVRHPNEIAYAHSTLMNAMTKDQVIVTTPGYVEEICILEPKTETTKPEVIIGYRNRVLNALGIGFVSNESKSSYNSISVNVDELLKTINKITAQIEKTINKYYKVICVENGIEIGYAPKIKVQPTQYINPDNLNKLVDLLYSKIGVSYKTAFNMLGIDYQTEIQNRIDENEYVYDGKTVDLDEVFAPHGNSYTANSNELMDKGKNNRTEENQNRDLDEQQENKARLENQTD
ncbi:MAG: hypothetical protein ACRDDY_03215, partial [Clostridium sp.]|uniref:hypothetical protein n=1 Tax=Clostridium sp. TaxID=1506 RepID=UPI003EE7D4F4